MNTFDIRYVRANLSQLVEQAARGEAFVIAKAGKPLAKVTALDEPMASRLSRLGFLAGQIAVPADFDRMSGAEIEQMFGVPE